MTDGQMGRLTDGWMDKETETQTYGQTDQQTEGQTVGRMDRQTNSKSTHSTGLCHAAALPPSKNMNTLQTYVEQGREPLTI